MSNQCHFRTTLTSGSSQPDIEILQPINTELLITRNLAASWFTKLPGVKVQGVLRSLNVGVLCAVVVADTVGQSETCFCAVYPLDESW